MSAVKIFLAGVITGLVLSVVGVSGALRIVDRGLEVVKVKSTELAR